MAWWYKVQDWYSLLFRIKKIVNKNKIGVTELEAESICGCNSRGGKMRAINQLCSNFGSPTSRLETSLASLHCRPSYSKI